MINKLAVAYILIFTTVILAMYSSCLEAILEFSNLTISPREVESRQSSTISVTFPVCNGDVSTTISAPINEDRSKKWLALSYKRERLIVFIIFSNKNKGEV